MMQPFEKTLPFKTDGAYHGFAEVSGMMHIDRDDLELEFEVKDSFFGALKSGPKKLEIDYADLSKLTYVRTLFKSRLEIKVKSLRILSRFPAAKDGLISLKISRKLKEETEDIVTYVNLRIAEIGLEKLGG
jgi:hypothetical protein